jgi:hypothetical protein
MEYTGSGREIEFSYPVKVVGYLLLLCLKLVL